MYTLIYFDDTDPAKLQDASHDEIVIAWAAISQMESILWNFKSDLDAWREPILQDESTRLLTRQDEISKLYATRFPEKCHLVEFRGESDGMGHYQIEEHMQKHLGNEGILYDSESGWFVVDTTQARADEVENFLKSHHPYLRFDRDTVEELDNVRPPMLGGWDVNSKYLKDNDVVVHYTLPKIPAKTGSELENVLEEARKLLKKTGLPLKKAIKLL